MLEIEDLLTPELVERVVKTKLDVKWMGGWCPVQSEGNLGKKRWYFRSRGDGWSFYLGEPNTDIFSHNDYFRTEDWGKWPDAGYMPLDIALGFILDCVEEYLDKNFNKS